MSRGDRETDYRQSEREENHQIRERERRIDPDAPSCDNCGYVGELRDCFGMGMRCQQCAEQLNNDA
jgi:hypothetical protein